MAYGFYFDSTRCTGCRTCEMACKDYKDLPADVAFRRVFDYEGGSCSLGADGTATCDAFMYHVSDACNHCENPKCFAACPTGAIEKDEDGIVFINQDTCTGNGACVDACPLRRADPGEGREQGQEVRHVPRPRGRGQAAHLRRGLPAARARVGRSGRAARRPIPTPWPASRLWPIRP